MSIKSMRVSSRSPKNVLILEDRRLTPEALQSLREFRRKRYQRSLPCQPKAA